MIDRAGDRFRIKAKTVQNRGLSRQEIRRRSRYRTPRDKGQPLLDLAALVENSVFEDAKTTARRRQGCLSDIKALLEVDDREDLCHPSMPRPAAIARGDVIEAQGWVAPRARLRVAAAAADDHRDPLVSELAHAMTAHRLVRLGELDGGVLGVVALENFDRRKEDDEVVGQRVQVTIVDHLSDG